MDELIKVMQIEKDLSRKNKITALIKQYCVKLVILNKNDKEYFKNIVSLFIKKEKVDFVHIGYEILIEIWLKRNLQ